MQFFFSGVSSSSGGVVCVCVGGDLPRAAELAMYAEGLNSDRQRAWMACYGRTHLVPNRTDPRGKTAMLTL